MKKIFPALWILCSLNTFALNRDSLLKVIPTIKDESERIHVMYEILANNNGSASEQLYYHRKLLDITKEINDKIGEAVATAELGYSVFQTGNTADGLKIIFDALTLAKNIKSQLALGIVYDNLAVCYTDPSKSMQYLRKALKASEAANDYLFVCYELDNISQYYITQKNMDSAMYFNQKCREIATARHIKLIVPGTFETAGVIQLSLGNKVVALQYLNMALKASFPVQDTSEQIGIYGLLSNFYKDGKKRDSAFYYAYKAYESSLNSYYTMQLGPSYLLWKLYDGLHKSDSALKYASQFYGIRDSMISNGKIMQMQTMVMLNDQRAAKEKEVYRQQQARLQNQVIIFFLASALLLFGVITFFLYRNNKTKQKANNLLQQQKLETDEQRLKAEEALHELKSTQAQLIQSEKMASLGELTAGIAHEIQNPLNFVNNFSEVSTELIDEMKAELSKANYDDANAIADDLKQNLEKINHHGKRAGDIVKGMLQHSRSGTGVKEPTNINALADEYLRLSYHGLRAKDKEFNAIMKTDFDETIGKINIIPQDIGRVLLNLYNNAFYAVNEMQKVCQAEPVEAGYEPTVSVTTKKSDNHVIITVSDNGNGISQKVVDKIFQPFFTTKPTGQGTGLGLSLSYDIIKAHGGEIKAESKEGEGTVFIIQLPVSV